MPAEFKHLPDGRRMPVLVRDDGAEKLWREGAAYIWPDPAEGIARYAELGHRWVTLDRGAQPMRVATLHEVMVEGGDLYFNGSNLHLPVGEPPIEVRNLWLEYPDRIWAVSIRPDSTIGLDDGAAFEIMVRLFADIAREEFEGDEQRATGVTDMLVVDGASKAVSRFVSGDLVCRAWSTAAGCFALISPGGSDQLRLATR